jgi:hypothetical protein
MTRAKKDHPKMRLCPKCQLETSDKALFCEHCGLNFASGRTIAEDSSQSKGSGRPSPSKSNPLGSLLGLIFSIGILYFLWTNFGYLLSTSSNDVGATSSQRSTHTVKYMADGDSFTEATGIVTVTLTNSSGGTEQRMVRTPWQTEFVAPSGLILSLSVSNSYDLGYSSAQIYVDGVSVQKAHSTSGMASVSGIVR